MSVRSNRNCAFTLVELLVVIGIIAVLIAVLLPALNKARDSARSVQCMSNMRQIAIATFNWANDHKGKMPTAASRSQYYVTSDGVFAGVGVDENLYANSANLADWICWKRHRDPIMGWVTTAPDCNITYSALTIYLGAKYVRTFNMQDSLDVNPKLDAVFRCPSDKIEQRPSNNDTSHGWYRYSFAMNANYAGIPGNATARPVADGVFNGKLSGIKNPAEKILFVCEESETLDDGQYSANPQRFLDGQYTDLVSSRHETSKRKRVAWGNDGGANGGNPKNSQDARGNVVFADGHGDFIGRKDALRQKHTGNSYPDPAGF